MARRPRRLALFFALVATFGLPPAAHATFPGENGKLALSGVYDPPQNPAGIYTMNPDGNDIVYLTSGTGPAWSPDGTKIAFATDRDGNSEIYSMNGDGTGQLRLTSNPAGDVAPSWSPDGQKIVFQTNRDGNNELYVMNADGTGQTRITHTPGSELAPKWSPGGTWIAFDDGLEISTIRPDGSDRTFRLEGGSPSWAPNGHDLWSYYIYYDESLEDYVSELQILDVETGAYDTSTVGSADPVVSPDGEAILHGSLSGGAKYIHDPPQGYQLPGSWSTADWQPLPVDSASTHARPAGATPFRVPLVPAARQCTTPNRTHAEPLAFPSCNPPVPESPHLTVGVGDGDPAPALSIGFVRLSVRPGVPGGADDAEVVIRSRLSNVMRTSDLSEYPGDLRASVRVRLTDKQGAVSQTTQGFPLEWEMPCASTAATNEGSLCEATTTLDALIPGAAAEGTRANWALDPVRIYDGGPDEDAATTGDNSLLATQGVFVP